LEEDAMNKLKIVWKEQFNSGYPVVDKQHQELISIINEFLDRLSADCPLSDVHYYMAEIHRLIEEHFAEEDGIMKSSGFPHVVDHTGDHVRLLQTIRDIEEGVASRGDQTSKADLAQAIEAWFSVHFLSHDALFHRFSHDQILSGR